MKNKLLKYGIGVLALVGAVTITYQITVKEARQSAMYSIEQVLKSMGE